MPKILERLARQLQAKGHSKSSSFAIGTKALQKSGNLKPGTATPTAKGVKRGNMTPEQRARTRANRSGK
jgi:hypothetical protein